MCIHCLGHLLLLPTATFLSPLPTPLTSRQSLLQFCWRADISNNKKDIAFLLIWGKDSYTERFLAVLPCTCVLQHKLIHFYQTSSLFPSHLLHFKVTILALLQWTHQTLSSFGFSTFPYSSCMYSPFSMWPMFNNITAFVLHLKSAYEGQHRIFGLLSLANVA
jgi:hypothetical protein